MAFPWIFANLAAGNQPASKLDDNFNALGKISTVPCTATGTNAYTLAPAAGSPTVTAYNQLQAFRAVIPATSTGAVTAGQAAPGLLACYKPSGSGPVAAGSGDVVIGECYDFVFDMALNSGAGGFHLYNVAGSGGSSGKFISRQSATPYTANANLTTTIPFDNTIPGLAEGTQILTVTATTGSSTQRVELRFSGFMTMGSQAGIAALNDGTTTVSSTYWNGTGFGGGAGNLLVIDHVYAPGAAGTYTFNIRVGGGTGTVRMNGDLSAQFLGGSMECTLVADVYEV